MHITSSDVVQFQALYKARFDVDIEAGIARQKLLLLTGQMVQIYRPVKHLQLVNLWNKDVNENIGNEQSRARHNS